MREALAGVAESDLERLGAVAGRLLAGRTSLALGPRPARGRAGVGYEFLEYRPYVPGDELRTVDWRASARSRRLQSRRYLDEASARWFVCLDGSSSMGVRGAEKWRLGLQLAAAWSYVLLRSGSWVGLAVFGDRVRRCCLPGPGRHQFHRILSLLAGETPPEPGRGTRLDQCAFLMGRRANAAVISDFLAPDALSGQLDELLSRGGEVHALQVLDPRECGLEAGAAVNLEDVETGRQRVLEASPAALAGAEACLRQVGEDLSGYCRGRSIPLTACRTDEAWREAVLRHLLALCGRRA